MEMMKEIKASQVSQDSKLEEMKASQDKIKISQVSQDQFEAKLEPMHAYLEEKLEEM